MGSPLERRLLQSTIPPKGGQGVARNVEWTLAKNNQSPFSPEGGRGVKTNND
jgi:hypothetical protein